MIVRRSSYDAAIAQRDEAQAYAERLLADRDRYRELWMKEQRASAAAHLVCAERARKIKLLSAKLERFTAPRKRDSNGHFLPVGGKA